MEGNRSDVGSRAALLWIVGAAGCASPAAETPPTPAGSTGMGSVSPPPSAPAEATGTSDPASTGSESDASGTSSTGAPALDPPLDVFFPRSALQPEQLGVVVNDNDPLSVQVAEYYVQARDIPRGNVVHVSFATDAVLPELDFAAAKAEVDAGLPDEVQGLALTWTTPYRVDCMSITSAFALGFDLSYCNTSGAACGETAPVEYYDSDTLLPWTDLGIRPTMMLAATTLEDAQALIDRGVAADGTHPDGDGYLVRTTDEARSVRYLDFIDTVDAWDDDRGLALQYVDNGDGDGLDYIENKSDVLFYFTGLTVVPEIGTNTYRPGAVADHLTSFGGFVPESSQMSALRWLEAGATATFGTVVEPCATPAKFPNTRTLLPQYFRGQTVLEAYWKSVRWPGEGLFMGEPLAKPWDGSTWSWDDGVLTLTTNLLIPGIDYDIQGADAPDGPWTTVISGSIPQTQTIDLVVENAGWAYYRLQPAG